ncbi:hypothetical protein M1247_19960 [Mycobacterium sp. 21AC1]|uniref:Rv0361 family membrane protein n=1 Tax=[Mycobacterium] appelbergii TaxID=2939269 RepID=UPI0029393C21|nr:hypothetical protein [Mycobacterium sp. 21AC1]MDV3127209.1 hypothetical protein [Mycobacterium sp. 21AC1]
MTYPPNYPPPGPDGPWQPQQPPPPQQYPPQYGAPQQYPDPQQPYGPPQQQYGQPYGQQYGAPQQQYGYGAPQQGYYPYPQPVPPSGGNGKWLWIIGAIVVVLVVVMGAVVFAFSGSVSDQAGSSSDEDAIRQLFEEASSNASADLSDALPYFCTADRKLLDSVGDLGSIDIPMQEQDTSTTIGDIDVNGDKATARIDNRAGAGKMYFRKESGEWKFCMSDMPGFPSMP